MREAWRLTLLAALVALAGCGQAGEPAPTTTLSPVPDDGTVTPRTPEPTRLVPGATTRGVDASTLVAAHAGALRNASVWFRFERTVRRANGSLRERRVVAGTAGPDASTYRIAVTERDARGEVTEATYRRNASEADRAVGNESDRGPPVDPYFAARLERLLSALAVRDVGRPPPNATQGIGTTYRIRADGFERGSDRSGEDVRFEATVEQRGIVMSYDLSYETTSGGRRLVVRERLSYRTVVFERFEEKRERER